MQVQRLCTTGIPPGIKPGLSTSALQQVSVDAGLASSDILESFRVGGSVQKLKQLQRRRGPAYSMASFNAGGMLQLMGGIRALFKCLYSTEIDKDFKGALWDLTGIKCLGDTFRQDYPQMHSVALASITTECPDYASGASNVRRNLKHGCDGDKGGWQFVLSVQPVLLLQPLIVEYEMVANALEVHDAAEVMFVAGAYKKAEYRVLAVKVTMQQYGDIVNKNRLMMVATHPCLKEHGEQYRLPIGDFSDAVSYCARDIVESKIAESQKRRFPDKPVRPWRDTPGSLQIVARYAPGQGFSDRVHASCSLDGLLPATTNHGGGRHMLPDWRPGDPVGQ